MEDVKKLEKDLNDSKMALFDVSVNLEELGTALNEVLNACNSWELLSIFMDPFYCLVNLSL